MALNEHCTNYLYAFVFFSINCSCWFFWLKYFYVLFSFNLFSSNGLFFFRVFPLFFYYVVYHSQSKIDEFFSSVLLMKKCSNSNCIMTTISDSVSVVLFVFSCKVEDANVQTLYSLKIIWYTYIYATYINDNSKLDLYVYMYSIQCTRSCWISLKWKKKRTNKRINQPNQQTNKIKTYELLDLDSL